MLWFMTQNLLCNWRTYLRVSTAGRQPSTVDPLKELSQIKSNSGPRSYSFLEQLVSNDWDIKVQLPSPRLETILTTIPLQSSLLGFLRLHHNPTSPMEIGLPYFAWHWSQKASLVNLLHSNFHLSVLSRNPTWDNSAKEDLGLIQI